jgi:sulfur-carrier protein adenylyltransferase/sulfurtransferase
MARLLAKTLAIVVFATTSLAGQAIRNVPRISIDELKALIEKNAVLVIDVRDADSFARGRIPGAVNVDFTQILQQADRFKNEKRTIVTYCACAREMTSARAAVDLAAKGIAGAKALVGGWDEWIARGEKVER